MGASHCYQEHTSNSLHYRQLKRSERRIEKSQSCLSLIQRKPTMSDKGYLAVPGTSHHEVQMEPENTINEDEALAVSEDENLAGDQPSESVNQQPTREHPLRSKTQIQRHLAARKKNQECRKGNPSTKKTHRQRNLRNVSQIKSQSKHHN